MADVVGLGSVFATLWSIVQWPVVALKNEGEKIPEDDRRPDVHRLNRENGEDR